MDSVDFERTNAFEGKYNGIQINEQDITRIANIITNYTANEGNKIDIRVESSDGKEVYTSYDPNFLLCEAMPREIRLVSIESVNDEESVKCSLIFDTRRNEPVKLSVTGSGSGVHVLFSDIDKELVAKQIFGYKILDIADRSWFVVGLSLLLAAVVYFVFDTWLDFLVNTFPDFKDSTTHIIIRTIGWSATLLVFMNGVFVVENVIKKLISPIQFSGQISDPSTKARKIRFWLFTSILVPLIIGFMPGLVFRLFNLVFDAPVP